ncbi:MAG: fibronectin type III domain-containing protein [Gaiellaceae bacterium]
MIKKAQVVLWLAAVVVGALATSSAGQGPPGGSPPGLDKAIAAKQKHAERMLDMPGVAGIAVALNKAGKPIIRIYRERDDVADLPDELEGVAVESVTTGVIEPYDHLPSHRYPRPVPIGVSAGLAGVATGTIGVRVTNGTNTYALSNNHVFAGVNTASIGDPIISPGDVDGGSDPGDRIGTLAAYQEIDFNGGTNTMDAAIALTSAANVGTSTPADGYGEPSPVTAAASSGLPVQKYGRTTGLQLGSVVDTNLSVDVCYIAFGEFCVQEARFAGQISVSPGPFSAPGDSGSLIVTQGSNQPVALLFAGGDGLTIGSPIDLVLQRFGVTIEGTPPGPGPPSAPTALSAVAGDDLVELNWAAPTFDGGSPVTHYNVFRGTSPGAETFLAANTSTTYADANAENGTTYYYRVSAVNANGEGPLSNRASATPLALVPPVEPLPTIDNFERGFENPLSDAGRWTNGVNGSAETGLYVPSIWLACSKTTTCTSWRNDSQYGPDAEVWGRLSVLPGDSNQLRLYARLRQPGSTAYDGYMLRTNQLSGTDQVFIERVDNDVFVNLKTINQELVAGDRLLLRVQGQVLEAWRHDGSAWARLGFAIDSTYAAGGFVGAGLRGTTGRLDDFGARTMGAPPPPPDTEPPTAPGSLSATATSSSQIDLSWQAATDNTAVTLYRIERCQGAGCSDFAEIGTTASTSFANTGLTASTSYTYRVRAQDAVPNMGPYSATATASTPAPPDTELPGAPGTPSLTPVSPTQIDLTWAAASDNVGVTLYRIERCSGAGCSVFNEVGTSSSTSFANTGLTASTSYTYRVRAQDAVPNMGPHSATATASTPSGVLAPVEPLPIVDSFNRRTESPLANGWSNGIGGSVETGLRVNSNTVQCTKTTTCTAWRTNPALGPDTEVWARVSTLPGNGNQFRLYARLQNAGSAAHSGYVLRTNQLAGTDQVLLERIDAGATDTRLTILQELAVGDTLLLRVKGSALEAWLKRGSTWTLLGSVADSTYGAAGRVGIGIRGKTGRLDDFGAR